MSYPDLMPLRSNSAVALRDIDVALDDNPTRRDAGGGNLLFQTSGEPTLEQRSIDDVPTALDRLERS